MKVEGGHFTPLVKATWCSRLLQAKLFIGNNPKFFNFFALQILQK